MVAIHSAIKITTRNKTQADALVSTTPLIPTIHNSSVTCLFLSRAARCLRARAKEQIMTDLRPLHSHRRWCNSQAMILTLVTYLMTVFLLIDFYPHPVSM
jgi:hypothetical protein